MRMSEMNFRDENGGETEREKHLYACHRFVFVAAASSINDGT